MQWQNYVSETYPFVWTANETSPRDKIRINQSKDVVLFSHKNPRTQSLKMAASAMEVRRKHLRQIILEKFILRGNHLRNHAFLLTVTERSSSLIIIYKTNNIFSPRRRHRFSAITRCLSCQFSAHSDMYPAEWMASCDINKGRVPATCHSWDFNKRHVQAPRDIFPRLVPSCVPIFKNNQRTNVVLNEGLTFWNCERYFSNH